jgi:hypothetical protein
MGSPSVTRGPPPPEDPETTMGSAVAEPVEPEVLEDSLEAVAPPALPVDPEVVLVVVSAEPLVAEEVASEEVPTVPEVPPSPELPEVALGSEEAEPVVVEPEEPESPEEAELDPPPAEPP